MRWSAIAAVLLVVAVASLALNAYQYSSPKSVTVITTVTTATTTCIESASNSMNAITTDCLLGITLGLRTNPEALPGQNETVFVSLTNDLAIPDDVNYTGLPTLPHGPNLSSAPAVDYMLPMPPPCGYPSLSTYEPAFIALYNGSGFPLQLSDSPPSAVSCIIMQGQDHHTFNASQTITEALSIGGYWTSPNADQPWVNATYKGLSPGNYTIFAFDPWQRLAELNFMVPVSSSFDFLSAAGICTQRGGYAPCWGGDAYVFDCASSAATSQGCTQRVTSAKAPYPSYTINIRYPFTNQTEPSWANCLWTVHGITHGQGYAYCISVNSTSFVVGEQPPAHP